MRTCKDCSKEKPLTSEFWPIHRFASGNSGFRHRCKLCTNALLKDKAKERMRKVRANDGGASARVAVKKWKTANFLRVHAMRQSSIHSRVPLEQRPRWGSRKEMQALYRTARMLRDMGQDIVIDHCIPLHGELVCGLHVLNNLRLCSSSENRAKGSRFDPESWVEPAWS
jgi:hypothetical protein